MATADPNPAHDSGPALEAWIRDAAARMDAAGLVFGHGTTESVDEACWIAAHVLGLPLDFGDDVLARKPDGVERVRLDTLLAERIDTRKPLAYLTGEAWFAGLPFIVDERVLVPRSPIAELILEGFAPWLDIEHAARAVDVGTGSGAIAAALAVYWPRLRIDALDIDADVLAVAAANVERHGVGDRIRLLESDLLAGVAGERYDLIVSNPPYVPESSLRDLPPEYAHEPRRALAAGARGLDDILRLLGQAPAHMNPGGCLVMEVGEAADALVEALPEVPFVWLEFARGGEGVCLLDVPGCETATRGVERLDAD